MSVAAHAPGKLFIAGEYAVVEPGESAILIAANRYLTVRARLADGRGSGSAHPQLEALGVSHIHGEDPKLATSPHLREVLRALHELSRERGKPTPALELHLQNNLNGSGGRKLGLGSSAAIAVALVQAANEVWELRLSPLERFRLALLGSLAVSPRASGGDIAAATFGGWLRYSSPDRAQLLADRARHGISGALESSGWQPSTLRHLPEPTAHELWVGWTGSPAKTDSLVSSLDSYRKTAGYRQFLARSRECVDELTRGLESGGTALLEPVREARRNLLRLGEGAGIEIETHSLSVLCDSAETHGAAAKPSGAGGGDCGIVLAPHSANTTLMLAEWIRSGITNLELAVHPAAEVQL